ncbi:hypothetical protein LVJ82_02790 [Vitreoscilla massiliensis]|uniref:Uncharacterized protein n=1 Tax=Vitreoscilla massiliensis TaxID=1689272 RepID=A0ABY4E2D5_9NEIS|nr:hypothetical protein [Vitreoscilla massiliensis]UOO89932.1 hypothetical protein LVJ82_02790 [Vitreoscilla massiliensis]
MRELFLKQQTPIFIAYLCLVSIFGIYFDEVSTGTYFPAEILLFSCAYLNFRLNKDQQSSDALLLIAMLLTICIFIVRMIDGFEATKMIVLSGLYFVPMMTWCVLIYVFYLYKK